jgi:hypothetical protein
MSPSEYRREATALLFVDPYNYFLSEGGLIWPRIREVAEEVGLLDNLRAIHAAARAADIRICIVPHRQWEKGDYESWRHVNPTQRSIMRSHSFAKGTWGGEFHADFAPRDGDVVVRQHWGQSGFANTDASPSTCCSRSRSHVAPPTRSGRPAPWYSWAARAHAARELASESPRQPPSRSPGGKRLRFHRAREEVKREGGVRA